ncbi:hypothetical protein [Rickettsia endosymbiont of Gonocerus acuteangulatus]
MKIKYNDFFAESVIEEINNTKLTLCYSKYAKNSYYTAMFYSEALHNIP